MANKAALVEQIKGIQRSDPDAKQAWWDHCNLHLGGVKDPNRHDADVLSEFVLSYKSGSGWGYTTGAGFGGFSGGGGAGAAAVGSWAASAGAGGGSGLAEFIKTGQRQSQSWKTAWQTYCTINGSKYSDPTKYDDTFIIGFIDYIGQVASEDLSTAAQEQNISLTTAPSVIGAGTKRLHSPGPSLTIVPPAKRQAVASEMGDGGDCDPEKADLVSKIKALQRNDQEAKSAWWQFCTDTLGGVKDPNRHDAAVLQQFLATYE